jgi:hypothetical protein
MVGPTNDLVKNHGFTSTAGSGHCQFHVFLLPTPSFLWLGSEWNRWYLKLRRVQGFKMGLVSKY